MNILKSIHKKETPIALAVEWPNGHVFSVLIRPEQSGKINHFYQPGVFNLFLDHSEEERGKLEELIAKKLYQLPVEKHPDYLGRILFDHGGNWIYDGADLGIAEQEQIAEFISQLLG